MDRYSIGRNFIPEADRKKESAALKTLGLAFGAMLIGYVILRPHSGVAIKRLAR